MLDSQRCHRKVPHYRKSYFLVTPFNLLSPFVQTPNIKLARNTSNSVREVLYNLRISFQERRKQLNNFTSNNVFLKVFVWVFFYLEYFFQFFHSRNERILTHNDFTSFRSKCWHYYQYFLSNNTLKISKRSIWEISKINNWH